MSLKSIANTFRRKYLKKITEDLGKSSHKNLTPQPQPLVINRILISRPNHRLGNQLLITPLVQEVQQLFPKASIDLFVKGTVAPILFKNYGINEYIKLPRKPLKELTNYFKVWLKIRNKKYDLVINVEQSSSSGRISAAVAQAKFTFFGDDFDEDLKKYADRSHISKYPIYNLRSFLNRLGMQVSNKEIPLLDLRLDTEELANGKKALANITDHPNKKTIGFFTYATGDKCYSKEWWKTFYNKFYHEFSDYNLIEILPVENISQLDFTLPSYYSKEVREIGAVMHQCDLVVAADSGMMHLSSASLTPTIGLFSVTKAEVYEPYGNNSISFNTNERTQDELILEMKRILDIIK